MSGNRSAWMTPCGRSPRPVGFEVGQFVLDQRRQVGRDVAGAVGEAVIERAPAGQARARWRGARQSLRRRGAACASARPTAAQWAAVGRRTQKPSRKVTSAAGRPDSCAQVAAFGIAHRRRAGDAVRGQVLHQPEVERQVAGLDALFVEREDERAPRRVHDVVGVLDALGDALEGQQLAQAIAGDEARQLLVADFGVDGHGCLDFRATSGDGGGGAQLARNVEGDALERRGDRLDRHVEALAEGLDDLFDERSRGPRRRP